MRRVAFLERREKVTDMAKILIVEDDADIRRGLMVRLRANKYDTVWTQDAISVTGIAEREKPDLIVLDIGLPGGDGFLVLERLKSMGLEIPIIVLSARDPDLNRGRALAAGAKAFLEKPADNRELLAAIRAALTGSGAARA